MANLDSKMRLQEGPEEKVDQAGPSEIKRSSKFVTAYDLYLVLVVGLIKIADHGSFLKLKALFARVAAFAAFQLARRKRRFRKAGLSQALQCTDLEIQNIVRQSFYDYWHDIFFSLSPSGSRAGHVKTELRGLRLLEEAFEKGRGVILWESSFFGRRVLAKRILYENAFSVSQVHNEHHIGGFRNPKSWISKHVIQPFFENCEKPFLREIIYLNSSDSLAFTKVLAERLKQNRIICISSDGRAGHKFIPVPFLGQTQFSPTGIVSLAKLLGAAILPLFCVQDGNRTRFIIESPIRIEAGGDRERCLEDSLKQYAGLLESYIKRYPEQYRDWQSLGGAGRRWMGVGTNPTLRPKVESGS